MGVEPFLLASSLSGVVAQRLVRRLCAACKAPSPATDSEAAALGISARDAPPVLHHAVGCPACRQQGYLGRFAVFEVVRVDEAMRERISRSASEQELTALARRCSPGIADNARAAVLAGDTTAEEALRVIRGD